MLSPGRTRILFFLLALSLVLCGSGFASEVLQPERERWIGPGVRSYRILEPEVPRAAYVIEVDLSNPYITLELGMSNERLTGNETVRSIAERHNHPKHWVIGAVNGDFWADSGVPTNMVVKEGKLVKSPGRRSVFAMRADNQPLIDFFETRFTVKGSQGGTLDFSDLNGTPKEGDRPMLLTPARTDTVTAPVGNHTIVLAPEIWEINLQDNLTANVLRLAGDAEAVGISETQFALLVPGERFSDFPEGFALGDNIDIQVETRARQSGKVTDLKLALGGGPRLLEDGQVAVDKYGETGQSFNTTRHPRTAVGISQDEKTLYLVVVDGGQVGYSIGIDLYDLAEFMRDLGAYQAMNLDGGGSSTMVVRGQTINRPSDSSGDRPVTNCLMIISTAPLGAVRHFRIEPAAFEVFPGQPIDLTVTARDEFYNDIAIPPQLLHWSIAEGRGRIDDQGRFRGASQPGRAIVQATVEGVIGSSLLSLQAKAIATTVQAEELRLVPEQIALSPGQQLEIKAEARNARGQWTAVPGETLRWKLKGKQLGELSGEGVFSASREGRGRIEARLGRLRARADLLVGTKRFELLEDFSEVSDWRLTGARVPMHRCRIQPAVDQVAAGTRALRLDYELRGSDGTAALYLNTYKSLPRVFEQISFWLYGNGCDHLFRMVLQDVDGQKFLADAPGAINWSGEWKKIEVPFAKFTPHWGNPTAKPDAPFHLEQLYLVEPRTAKKSRGTLFLDDLIAVYPPQGE